MVKMLNTIIFQKGIEMYKVVEIFTSIQGEGLCMGLPATFVRLFGCNLKCTFCDEPKHTQYDLVKIMSQEKILENIQADLVVITGGEPSIQDLNPLIWFLQESGKEVQVETNGFSYINIEDADMITLSPKKENPRPKGGWHEIKLLVSAIDYDRVEEEIKYWQGLMVPICLQPINGPDKVNPESLKVAMKLALKYKLRLSPQLHKLIGVE